MADQKEYRPWEKGQAPLEDAVKNTRDTKEVDEGQLAVSGIREKMGQVLKKDQALKVSLYTPEPEPDRAEGETWVDSRGRGWKWTNGKKEAHTMLQDAKRPWFCPACGKVMNAKVDDRMWLLRGKCFDCVIADETKMRIDGTWAKYEKEKMLANQIAFMRDRINEMESWIASIADPELHFMDGRFETWHIGVDKIKADLQEEVDQLKSLLTQAQDYYDNEFPAAVVEHKPVG